ncbi:vanillic acid non-oxidative decarboxylation protein [bacterium DOLZORAL124_64_63]|nr:MAG: vanillic acid non-oxidative decarboxylation protein [bacterium DOLZORAL124_64_63]
MQCVRCLKEGVSVVAKAPDGSGAWEIYKCDHCNYGWRSTEPETITVIEKRDPRFQMDGVDVETLLNPCPIPPLEK